MERSARRTSPQPSAPSAGRAAGQAVARSSAPVAAASPQNTWLLRTADFRRVYDQGSRRQYGWLMAFILRTENAASRIGLTLPAKFGNAVKRNRMKRRLRHAVTGCWSELQPGWDIVLHPRAAGLTMEFSEIIATLRKLFQFCSRPRAPLAPAATAVETPEGGDPPGRPAGAAS